MSNSQCTDSRIRKVVSLKPEHYQILVREGRKKRETISETFARIIKEYSCFCPYPVDFDSEPAD